MPLDALCLAAVCDELSQQIIGSKIDKVGQPERDLIVLSLRSKSVSACRLLISAGSGDARVHLTNFQFENPASPPMFCMLLRKHLSGARIIDVRQVPSERVMELTLSTVDSIGDIAEKRLILELIGSLSNIILVDNKGIIIDCLRRIGLDNSGKRAMLPGLLYQAPTPQIGKQNPLSIGTDKTGDGSLSWFCQDREPSPCVPVDKWLLSKFYGLSPLICRELSWRAYGAADFRLSDITDDGEKLRKEFVALMSTVNARKFEPCMLIDRDTNSPCDFSFTHIRQYENAVDIEIFDDFSKMLDTYYTRKAQAARTNQRASNTIKTVKTARDRLVRKLITQKAELAKTADRDYLRECGDIIMTNLHQMKKGQKELIAPDFYSADGGNRKISLNHLNTPQQNAAKYYKKYTKAKTAEKFLSEQIEYGEKELEYLESVLGAIAYAEGETDIQEIRRELISAGYLKTQKVQTPGAGKNRKSGAQRQGIKSAESAPMKFMSSTGMSILAGKNNMQNDRLTLKTAKKSDMWLHAQKIHGSHVIISCADSSPDETTLFEAASIAAYYSSARASSKIPIDYTPVRYVKKPSGGRPGMVIYTNYKTITVTPDEELVNRLRV